MKTLQFDTNIGFNTHLTVLCLNNKYNHVSPEVVQAKDFMKSIEFTFPAGRIEMFGVDKNIPVLTIVDYKLLDAFRETLVTLCGLKENTDAFKPYNPHITLPKFFGYTIPRTITLSRLHYAR